MACIYISTFTDERIYQYPSDNTIPDTSISQRNRHFKNTHPDLSGSPTAAERQPSDPQGA